MQSASVKGWLNSHKVLLTFLLILCIGLYTRFHAIEQTTAFGFDQGRDAWEVYDITQGKHTFKGPKTGIGDFYLGPAYFYILTPFYLVAGMDPMGANYFNVVAVLFTFITIFYITKKIINERAALFATILYVSCDYIIAKNQVPWNVSLIVPIAYIIFFCTYKIFQGARIWYAPLLFLTGFLFHIHFTVVFILPLILYIILISKNKKANIKAFLLSLPLFIVWFIPIIAFDLSRHNDNYFRFNSFLRDYAMGFHLRFLLHRAPDTLIQISALFPRYASQAAGLIIPIAFIAYMLKEKNKKLRSLLWLVPPWYIIPLLGFSLYKGPISDYYYFINQPISILIIVYLNEKLLQKKALPITLIVIVIWAFYVYTNLRPYMQKPDKDGGLAHQKEDVRNAIAGNQKLGYIENDIKSYMYAIWTRKH